MLNAKVAGRVDAAFAVARLRSMAALSKFEIAAIQAAANESRYAPSGAQIVQEGREPIGHSILLTGWMAQLKILPDGRRQITALILPGETFGSFRSRLSTAATSIVALEKSVYCPAPEAVPGSALDEAYEHGEVEQYTRAIDHITRLGRLNARERIYDLLLELIERLTLSDVCGIDGFLIPLTQETFADALGLTPVHVNRTLQICRASGDLSWSGKTVKVHDMEGLYRKLGRRVWQGPAQLAWAS